MKEKIYKLIQEYNSIIIARHKNPDFDAYGSQFGLYHALKERFPDKDIYVVGDTNALNYFGDFQEVTTDTFKESLVLILDTVSSQMLDPCVYENHDKLVFIDHHRNDPDIKHDLAYQLYEASSTSEIVASLLIEWGLTINFESARALYLGIIGDTGRFLYNNTTSETFHIASELMKKGLDIQEIHNTVYLETKRSKEIKNVFFNEVQYTKNNVAYKKNDETFLNQYNLTTSYASRGLVNQMSGMIEVPIWVNFTIDLETSKIICEMRSREIAVLTIAKKYGGGGHLNACGCTLDSWEDTDKVIEDLDRLAEEHK